MFISEQWFQELKIEKIDVIKIKKEVEEYRKRLIMLEQENEQLKEAIQVLDTAV